MLHEYPVIIDGSKNLVIIPINVNVSSDLSVEDHLGTVVPLKSFNIATKTLYLEEASIVRFQVVAARMDHSACLYPDFTGVRT